MSRWKTRFAVPSGTAGLIGEGLCLGLSLLGSFAVFRLLNDPLPGSLGALCVSAATGFGAGWWIVRSRRAALVVLLSGLALVAVIVEGAVPVAWHHLLVDSHTWHQVSTALRVDRDRTVLAASLLVGVVGTAERVTVGYRYRSQGTRRPGLAVLAALALVTWSIARVPGWDAAGLGAGMIVIGGLLLLDGEFPGREATVATQTGGGRRLAWERRLLVVLVPPLAVFWAVVVTVSASGAIGSSASSSAAAANTSTVEALVTNVVGFAERDPGVVLFRARSTLPTYWQVAILTKEIGGTWEISSNLARAIGGHGPAPGDADVSISGNGDPSPLSAEVTVASYLGRVLPVPIGTTSVDAPSSTRMVDGAVVQDRQTTPGERYEATANVSSVDQASRTPGPGTGVTGIKRGPGSPASVSIPHEVRTIARGVVAGSDGRRQMVQRLVNWFRSGRFRYTTTMQPAPPPGMTPMVAFLTRTKSGNCQTFTDAFAMMAQSLGIPVRVAVGFTSGTATPGEETTVTGADAHTWPEVYLGSGIGWASVEPTPPSKISAIAPVGVLGLGPVTTPTTQPSSPPPIVPRSTNPRTTAVPPVTAVTPPTSSPTERPVTTDRKRSEPILWIGLGVGALVLTVVGVALLARRRTRQIRREPYQTVVEAWSMCDRSLTRVGFSCPPNRTHIDHAARLRTAARQAVSGATPPSLEQLVDDVQVVALLEREARYGRGPVGGDAAGEAAAAAHRVHRALRQRRLRRAARARLATPTTPGQGAYGTGDPAHASSRYGVSDAGGALRAADRTRV